MQDNGGNEVSWPMQAMPRAIMRPECGRGIGIIVTISDWRKLSLKESVNGVVHGSSREFVLKANATQYLASVA